ncbi:hypothetical protein M404DRAFT_20350 [Pisolithus tinctorius Marx 270]|uniref:Uncharacterized protein n=1 Tax=Pisolithus tinctorius Marx 270 TaxID=870435 RepID=A0A0C3PD85_PISTI|nr:hypothetical protein M404DRAFT_20350 [Pisolithus tinctorius Marx 270]
MSPITCGMARKGIRRYVPYNLRSRGPNQTFLDLSSLPSTPRTPVHLHNATGARAGVPTPPLPIHAAEGNPPENANEFICPDVRKAIQDGIPPEVVGYGIKLRFVRDCLELAKAVDEEKKNMLRALEAGEVISWERLDMFGQGALGYVEACMEIAAGVIVMADEIHKWGFSTVDKD